MMQLDLERAGIPYCDEDGLYADFHANRHTFISNLAKAGIAPKIAQTVARHSDVNLTLNVYNHVGIQDQAAAIASLVGPPELTEAGEAALVISPDQPADAGKFAHGFAQTPDPEGQSASSTGTEPGAPPAGQETEKPLPGQGLGIACQPLAAPDRSTPEATLFVTTLTFCSSRKTLQQRALRSSRPIRPPIPV